MQIVSSNRKDKKPLVSQLRDMQVSDTRALEVQKKDVKYARVAISRLHSETSMRFETSRIEGDLKKTGWIHVWRIA